MNQRPGVSGEEGSKQLPRGVISGLCSHLLTDALVAVSELNGQVLDALSSSAQTPRAFPLGPKLQARCAALSDLQRHRASRCGVLLADVGFADSERWRSLALRGECEDQILQNDWLAVDEAVALASTVLLVAWHVLRVRPSIAGFLLGMPVTTVSAFRQLGVAELTRVARQHPQWVRPRWSNRLDLWNCILAVEGDAPSQDETSLVLRCLTASAAMSSRLVLSVESIV